MTKQDFELIARVLNSIPDETTRHTLASLFVVELQRINPRFEELRFRMACGDIPENVQRAVRKLVKT